MGRTVAELQASMSWRELQCWAAYARQRPFLDHALDVHLATLSAIVSQAVGGRQTVRDFMLNDREAVLDDDLDDGLTIAERVARQGGV